MHGTVEERFPFLVIEHSRNTRPGITINNAWDNCGSETIVPRQADRRNVYLTHTYACVVPLATATKAAHLGDLASADVTCSGSVERGKPHPLRVV